MAFRIGCGHVCFRETLAIALPFSAALFLWLGRKKQFSQDEASSFVFDYGKHLGVSILGTLGFVLALFLLEMLLYKTRGHAA